MRCLIGLLRATSGQILFEGQPITDLPADTRARLGIGYIPQGRQVFPRMTVEENISVSLLAGRGKDRRLAELAYQYFPILKERRRQSAGTLSGGEQQQLAIGRAMVGNPRLMLLDEPSEGIQPSIVQMICEVLKSVRDQLGTTILFVEQNLDTILAISERCYVADKGTIIAEISRDQLRTRDAVRRICSFSCSGGTFQPRRAAARKKTVATLPRAGAIPPKTPGGGTTNSECPPEPRRDPVLIADVPRT
jgi:branched-chain amino acid transport system ATP-binding protein